MLVFHQISTLQKYLQNAVNASPTTGFVPTMGALHKGHLSLIEASKKETSLTICSIFVNPAQFNNPSDFEKYPITIAEDIRLLELAGCDVLFLPSVAEIYPDGMEKKKDYDLGFLETVLEGPSRPGHFQGVCMVMERLLSIVQPHHLFMGLKDYQQCMVVKRLLQLKGWEQSIHYHPCPTLREADGLAMSSRNMRLTSEQRGVAPVIHQALLHIKHHLKAGTLHHLKNEAATMLRNKGVRIDYVEIADAFTLEPLNEWNGAQPATALIAAFLGDVRLIDNLILTS